MSRSKFLFKNRIREYRIIEGLSQEQLGAQIGVSGNTVSNWETYVFIPTAFYAAKLLSLFNCTFEDLFYFDLKE